MRVNGERRFNGLPFLVFHVEGLCLALLGEEVFPGRFNFVTLLDLAMAMAFQHVFARRTNDVL